MHKQTPITWSRTTTKLKLSSRLHPVKDNVWRPALEVLPELWGLFFGRVKSRF